MFKIALVVFRECLEISILLGIIMTTTQNIKDRGIYIISGIISGILGAIIIAYFASTIAHAYGGIGDEILDIAAICLTVLIIGYIVVWMQGYGNQVKAAVYTATENIERGRSNKISLAMVVAITMFREFAEIMLLMYGLTSTSSKNEASYAAGFGLGVFGGIISGIIVYFVLGKLGRIRAFKVCSIMLIFMAAGLASEAAGILTSTGMIEVFNRAAWDTSWLISDNSAFGQILRIVLGYSAKPNVLQLLLYSSTLVTLWLLRYVRALK